MNGQYLSALPAAELLPAVAARAGADGRGPRGARPAARSSTRSRPARAPSSTSRSRSRCGSIPSRATLDAKGEALIHKMGPAFAANLERAAGALDALAPADWTAEAILAALKGWRRRTGSSWATPCSRFVWRSPAPPCPSRSTSCSPWWIVRAASRASAMWRAASDRRRGPGVHGMTRGAGLALALAGADGLRGKPAARPPSRPDTAPPPAGAPASPLRPRPSAGAAPMPGAPGVRRRHQPGHPTLPDGVPPTAGAGCSTPRGPRCPATWSSETSRACSPTRARRQVRSRLRAAASGRPIARRTIGRPPVDTAEVRPGCYAFRTPTALAPRLVDAGFTHLNLANNHANDLRPGGPRLHRADPRQPRPPALRAAGPYRHRHRAAGRQRGHGRADRLRHLPLRLRSARHRAQRRGRRLGPAAGGPAHRHLPWRRRGGARAARAGDRGIAGPRAARRPSPLGPRGDRRGRRRGRRAWAARAPRHRVLPRAPDRVLAGELPHLSRLQPGGPAWCDRRAPARVRARPPAGCARAWFP